MTGAVAVASPGAAALTAPSSAPISASAAASAATPIIQPASWSRDVSATAVPPVRRPRRSTVTASQKPNTSRNLCVMISTDSRPCAHSPFSRPSTSSASCGVSTEVGSSSTRKRRRAYSAFRISSFCFSPAASPATRASSASGKGASRRNADSRSRSARQSMRAGSSVRASARFSATVMPGTTVKCWKIMPMPWAAASRGLAIATSRPSTSTVPASGRWKPISAFTSVDLPAPFSPSNAWNEPASTVIDTSSSACSAPKRLEKPSISTRAAPVGSSRGGMRIALASAARQRSAARIAGDAATAPNTPPCIVTIFNAAS
jgi:hypothetical protein